MKLSRDRFPAVIGLKQWSWLFLFIITMIAIPPANAQVSSVTVGVDGMSCPFCAFGVEKRLKKVDGAGSVKVAVETFIVAVFVVVGNRIGTWAGSHFF